MDSFTAKGALLVGYDLIRRRPLLVLLWAVVFLAVDLATLAAFDAFRAWRETALAGRGAYGVMRMSMAYNAAAIVMTTIVQGALWASAFRALLGLSGRLGGRALMAAVSWVVVQLIATLASVPLTVFVTERAVSVFGPTAAFSPALRAPAAVLGAMGLYWAAVAGTWAVARGEIALLRCWSMTRGRFWTVTGLVAGLAVVVYVLRAALRALLGVLHPHGGVITLQGLVASPAIFVTLTGVVITALQMVFLAGIVTSAYRASRSDRQTASFSSGAAAATG
jgi:hypothetical protein